MINVFITDLRKFNSGELVGDWFDLPVDKEDLEKELSKYNNNVFISDFEIDENIKGIFDVKEYTNLFILNNALTNISQLEDYEIKQLNSLVEFNYINDIYALDLYDLKRAIENI